MKRIYKAGGTPAVHLWALLLVGVSLSAQESAFVAHQQQMALLPGSISSMSMVDGELYCYTDGVLLKALRSRQHLMGFQADTAFVKLGEGIEYVVRHPSTGDLYYVKRDKKDRPYLYRCQDFGPEGGKSKQVRLNGGWFNKGMTVEHPVFTADGKVMIFTSLESRHSHGGYDLWYCTLDDGQWSRPQNLGGRLNSNGDEISPTIYRDCLLFASNGGKGSGGRFSLYSTRLISKSVDSDTVGMLLIGRCLSQVLPEPFNKPGADDYNMVMDSARGCGYWVSTRKRTDTDSELYSFSGSLDGIDLFGRVTDKWGEPLPGVRVTVHQGDAVVCNTYTNGEGRYRVYLQCDEYYDLSFQMDGFFVGFESVNTAKGDEEYLLAEARLDIQLDKLPLGESIVYSDLFGPDVDVELSERGMEQLAPLVRFVSDNPSVQVEMKLVNDLTNNATFNELLTEQRIQTLENYLFPMLPASAKMSIANGCQGKETCGAASGKSVLTVLIHK